MSRFILQPDSGTDKPIATSLGGREWSKSQTDEELRDRNIGQAIATDGDLAFVQDDGRVVALDIDSGNDIWIHEAQETTQYGMFHDESRDEVISLSGASIIRLDPVDGSLIDKWEYDEPGVSRAIKYRDGYIYTFDFDPDSDNEYVAVIHDIDAQESITATDTIGSDDFHTHLDVEVVEDGYLVRHTDPNRVELYEADT